MFTIDRSFFEKKKEIAVKKLESAERECIDSNTTIIILTRLLEDAAGTNAIDFLRLKKESAKRQLKSLEADFYKLSGYIDAIDDMTLQFVSHSIVDEIDAAVYQCSQG